MRIARIRIENFRSVKSIDFAPGNLCGLVGENNAGKSNILRAVNLILGEAWPSERAFGPEDFHNHDTSKPIIIEVWRDTPVMLNRQGVDLACHGLRITVGRYKRAVKSKEKVAGNLKFDFDPLDEQGEVLSAPSQPFAQGVRARWGPVRVSNEIRDGFPFVYVDVRRDYSRHTPGSSPGGCREVEGVPRPVEGRGVGRVKTCPPRSSRACVSICYAGGHEERD